MATSQFDIPNTQTPLDIGGMQKENTDYFNNLSSFIPKSTGQIESGLGLPQMRENVARGGEVLNNLQSSIFGMPQQVADTSRNSLMNEGQRQGMIQAKQLPLQQAYAQGSQGQAAAEKTLGETENLAGQREQAALLPWEKQYDAITRTQAAQLTGWTDTNKNELDRLIANQNAGLTWTNDEANRANALALQEAQYQNQLGLLDANTKKTNPYMNVPKGDSLFNIITGKSVMGPQTGGGGGADLSGYIL